MLNCDICGQEIENGTDYFEFPDGTTVCDYDYDCLTDYAKNFITTADYDEGPDPDEQLEYHRDMREEGLQ